MESTESTLVGPSGEKPLAFWWRDREKSMDITTMDITTMDITTMGTNITVTMGGVTAEVGVTATITWRWGAFMTDRRRNRATPPRSRNGAPIPSAEVNNNEPCKRIYEICLRFVIWSETVIFSQTAWHEYRSSSSLNWEKTGSFWCCWVLPWH